MRGQDNLRHFSVTGIGRRQTRHSQKEQRETFQQADTPVLRLAKVNLAQNQSPTVEPL